jgi:predicted Zn-dependent peptidase
MKTRPAAAGDFVGYSFSDGFRLFVYPTDRFKTTHVGLFLHRPLTRDATLLSLLESVLQRGCRGYPTMRAITQFMESLYGASFDTDVLKIGERQILALTMRLLNDRFAPKKVRSLEQSIDFMHRALAETLMEKKTLKREFVEQEKVNLERFLKGLINDRMGYAMLRCTQWMCRNEPYGIYEYGSTDDLPSIDAPRLTRYYHEILATSPIDLFVAGDHSPDHVARLVERRFRRLIARPPVNSIPAPSPAPSAKAREIKESLEVEQAKLILGFRAGRTLSDPDFPSFAFFNGILGAYPHSRLFADLREKMGLCYQAHSFVEATKGLLFIVMGIDAKNFDKARDRVLHHIRELQAGRFSDDEFSKTKELIVHAIRGREDSPRSKIFTCLEGLVNGRTWSTEQVLAKVKDVKKNEVAPAGDKISLDTVYLLSGR